MQSKYFKSSEFDSPDEKGSGERMSQEFIDLLDKMRQQCGFAFVVTSGFRTEKHNAEIRADGKESVDNSAHESGLAADIQTEDGYHKYKLIETAIKLGIKRIGIGRNFIHVDIDKSKPQEVVWFYGADR